MDPSNEEWQRHWIDAYGRAADVLGFNGFHLDTYGYPRCALDTQDRPVAIDSGYDDFVRSVRAERPRDVLSFNQVNGVPRGFQAPELPGFRYIEVWPPNDGWRHLEGLLSRSAGSAGPQGDTLAIYPPVWGRERASALRTAVLTEAVTTVLGANVLLWGDREGVLCHPYYVDHEDLRADEVEVALDWHRFALRTRDLFKSMEDTSWYELEDENASVTVSWEGESRPEPVAGSLFVRVRRSEEIVVLSLVDLTGSADGSWKSPTGVGRCREAEVSVLVNAPESWSAQVAVLGISGGRFRPRETTIGQHREGRSIRLRVPLTGGWSVVRLRARREGDD
jgi:dextranase